MGRRTVGTRLLEGWCALSGAGVCGLRTRYSTDLSRAEWEISVRWCQRSSPADDRRNTRRVWRLLPPDLRRGRRSADCWPGWQQEALTTAPHDGLADAAGA